VGIAYHLLANPSGGLASSEAGGDIGHTIAGAYRIPVLEGAGATNVTLREECVHLVGHIWNPVRSKQNKKTT